MSFNEVLLVAAAAFVAGGVNAIAGGGTFFSFPALLSVGVAPVVANASNTVALCPASLASAWAYRKESMRHGRMAWFLAIASMIGAVIGATILLNTTDAAFTVLIPWLLLGATLLFAFSKPISRFIAHLRVQALSLAKRQTIKSETTELASPSPVGGTFFQFMVGVYGGFFGAGMGILTLAALAMIGYEDIQELNALKNLTSGVNYFISACTFIIAGAISWPHTLVMLVAGIVGGYVGGCLARRLPAVWLRRLVIATGSILSLVFFIKVYF